jgi:hypothetical protein
MFSTKSFTRSIALASSLTFLAGSAAIAQTTRYDRTAANGYANRVVEGTVSSVAHERNGDRVRLTSGMDLLVPTSITGMRQGRRFGASTLVPGDVVRLNVYSREGDGRDAEVRSIEFLQSGNGTYNNSTRNGMNRNGVNRNGTNRVVSMTGSVVSVNRRARQIVVQADNGRAMTVDVSGVNGSWNSYRRGDRVVIDGVTRNGMFIASNLRNR